MLHFIKMHNLPYSVNDVQKIVGNCPICQELKPKFVKTNGTLIKATQPMQQLNIDFKGLLPASSQNKYILTIVDRFSRFPFAFLCKDMESKTVIKCFNQLFSLFGMPGFIHNDRAPDFISNEVKQYLHSKGITTSKTRNGQCERFNGVIWKLSTYASNLEIYLVLHGRLFFLTLCTVFNHYSAPQPIAHHMNACSSLIGNQQQVALYHLGYRHQDQSI